MVHPELEEKLYQAGQAMRRATGENIIVLCKQYLTLLDEYNGFGNSRTQLGLINRELTSHRLKRSVTSGPV